jgi:hypothetical protein
MKERRLRGEKSLSLPDILESVDQKCLDLLMEALRTSAPAAYPALREYLDHARASRPAYHEMAAKLGITMGCFERNVAYGMEHLVRALISQHLMGRELHGLSRYEFERTIGRARSAFTQCVSPRDHKAA